MSEIQGVNRFFHEVRGLIDAGEKETIDEMINQIKNQNLVEYIYNKYKDQFHEPYDNSVYNNKAINQHFDYPHLEDKFKKSREFNDDNGLLLIVFIFKIKLIK